NLVRAAARPKPARLARDHPCPPDNRRTQPERVLSPPQPWLLGGLRPRTSVGHPLRRHSRRSRIPKFPSRLEGVSRRQLMLNSVLQERRIIVAAYLDNRGFDVRQRRHAGPLV